MYIKYKISNLSLIDRILQLLQVHSRVAIFMSGKGSNAESILRHRNEYKNLEFVLICSDNPSSRAREIAVKHNLTHRLVTGRTKLLLEREKFFRIFESYLHDLNIDLVLYAGFMKVSPPFFIQRFPGLNIHPSDLTILESGKPKYPGINALSDAIRSGEPYVASTLYVVEEEIDAGFPLAVSTHLSVHPEDIHLIEVVHERLKTMCEHILYPRMLALLARGILKRENFPLLAQNGDLERYEKSVSTY